MLKNYWKINFELVESREWRVKSFSFSFHSPLSTLHSFMKRAIFPGSFDPLTMGHLDIIERSIDLFDEIIVAVLNNPDKNPMFSPTERCEMIENVFETFDSKDCKVIVESFQGLLVDYTKRRNATAIIRGIRAISDYEYELRMALMNRRLEPEIETVFLMAAEEYSYVSSHLLKQVFTLGGRVEGLVPTLIEEKMREKLHNDKGDLKL